MTHLLDFSSVNNCLDLSSSSLNYSELLNNDFKSTNNTWLISSSCSLDTSIKSDSSSSLRVIFLSVSYKVLVRSFTCRTKVGSACSITRRRPVRTRLLISLPFFRSVFLTHRQSRLLALSRVRENGKIMNDCVKWYPE